MLRRFFLRSTLGGGSMGLLAAIFYPVIRFVTPPKLSGAMVSSVVAAGLGELKPGTGKNFRFGSRPGLLIRTGSGQYRAFLAVCPHLQCTVQYREDLAQIWCACHNGRFDLNGRVVSGPPPKGLEEFKVDVRGDDVIVSMA